MPLAEHRDAARAHRPVSGRCVEQRGDMALHEATAQQGGAFARALAALDGIATRGLARLGRRPGLAAAALTVLCLLAIVPGLFTLPAVDRTEPRYAQASKQMLERGELSRPRFQDVPQFTKPAGVFWLQSLSAGLAGEAARDEIWAYRLPSAIGALLAVLITFFGARRLFGGEAAFLGAAFLGLNLIIVLQAHLALSKAPLLAFTVAAQWALARLYVSGRDEARRLDAAIFWAAQGGGILTGVMALPIVSLTTVIGLAVADRSVGWLRGLRAHWGLPLALIVASPWLIAIAGSAELRDAWADASWSQIAGPQEMNWRALPGVFIGVAGLTLFLSFVFMPRALRWLWSVRTEKGPRFLIVWAAAYLLALEMLSPKPPLYTLQSIFPALTMAMALALLADRDARAGWLNAGVSLLLGLLPVAMIGGLIWVMGPAPRALPALLWLLLFGATLATILAARRGRPMASAACYGVAALAFHAAFFGATLPRIERIWTTERLAGAAAVLKPCTQGHWGVAGYQEPSTVFRLGTDTYTPLVPEQGAAVAVWLADAPRSGAFITRRHVAGFKAELARLRAAPARRIACLEGYNSGRFEKFAIELYTTVPPDRLAGCPLPEKMRCAGSGN